MNTALKLALRAAMVLLIGAGAVLIVCSSLRGDGDRPARRETAPPAAVLPREGPQPPGPVETRPPVDEPRPAPDAEDTAPSPQPERPEARAPRDDSPLVMVRFTLALHDPENKRETATVTGDQAIMHPKSQVYDFVMPVVKLMVEAGAGEEFRIAAEEYEITAKSATADQERGVVQLFDNVVVRGKDFEVTTENVTVQARDRTLTSDAHVTMRRDRIDESGARTPVMTIKGRGLRVDLAAKTMTMNHNVEALLYDVSEDFLAADTDEPIQDVAITALGQMVYEHFARKVTFSDNVVAAAGQKTLRCDRLSILLKETDGDEGGLAVTNIVAAGNVSFNYKDQIARGEQLEWREVTHTGILTGEDCVLETPRFELAGRKLSFYRLNNHFKADGPGSLLWRASPTGEPEGQPRQPAPEPAGTDEAWEVGPLRLTETDPIRVTWQTAMSYDVPGRMAGFQGDVTASQKNSSLSCDSLRLDFAANTGDLQKVTAHGGVTVRDQWTAVSREVSCEELVWQAPEDRVELKAAEGKLVNITTGNQTIASRHIIFDNTNDALECPTAGSLTVSPPEDRGADEAADDAQIKVEWQKMMHFQRTPARVARFAGRVTARRGNQLIKAETLRVDFDQEWNPVLIAPTGEAMIDVYSERQKPAPSPPPSPAAEAGSPPQADEGPQQPAKDVEDKKPEAILPRALARQSGHWRLSGQAFTIEPPKQLLTSAAPGTLTVLEGDVATGTITWHNAMRLDSTNNVATFEGQVKADFPEAALQADELRMEFSAAGELRYVSARGKTSFAAKEPEGWELTCSWAEVIFAAGTALRQFIAHENVQVRDQNRTLNAGDLTLFLENVEGENAPVIARAIARTDVLVRYEQEERLEAGGDLLEWDRTTDTYVLTGEPYAFLRQGMVRWEHDRLLLERSTGKLSLPPGARPSRIIVGPDED